MSGSGMNKVALFIETASIAAQLSNYKYNMLLMYYHDISWPVKGDLFVQKISIFNPSWIK